MTSDLHAAKKNQNSRVSPPPTASDERNFDLADYDGVRAGSKCDHITPLLWKGEPSLDHTLPNTDTTNSEPGHHRLISIEQHNPKKNGRSAKNGGEFNGAAKWCSLMNRLPCRVRSINDETAKGFQVEFRSSASPPRMPSAILVPSFHVPRMPITRGRAQRVVEGQPSPLAYCSGERSNRDATPVPQ